MALSATLLALAVATSPLPPQRPANTDRPDRIEAPAATIPGKGSGQITTDTAAPVSAPPPPRRPSGLALAAVDPKPAPRLKPGQYVCKDPRLKGSRNGRVSGSIRGCGIPASVKVTAIAGIKLSAPATLDCPTARAFADWVTGVAAPAARRLLNRRLTKVWIYGSYSCRTRNSRPGAKLSEHSFGRAIDVSGFSFGDGQGMTVLKDWRSRRGRSFLRRVWKQACGPFKTVLGPEADRFHQDHLHLDTARRRSTYCR